MHDKIDNALIPNREKEIPFQSSNIPYWLSGYSTILTVVRPRIFLNSVDNYSYICGELTYATHIKNISAALKKEREIGD